MNKAVLLNNVRKTLHAATKDVGRLCTHINIDMWSEHKPIISPDRVSPLSPENFAYLNYGLSPVTTYGISNVIRLIRENKASWVYHKPTGGWDAPFRITDFDGYDHNAQPWFAMKGDREEVGPGQSLWLSVPTGVKIDHIMRTARLFTELSTTAWIGLIVWPEVDRYDVPPMLYLAARFDHISDFSQAFHLDISDDGLPADDSYGVVPVVCYAGVPEGTSDGTWLTQDAGSFIILADKPVWFEYVADPTNPLPKMLSVIDLGPDAVARWSSSSDYPQLPWKVEIEGVVADVTLSSNATESWTVGVTMSVVRLSSGDTPEQVHRETLTLSPGQTILVEMPKVSLFQRENGIMEVIIGFAAKGYTMELRFQVENAVTRINENQNTDNELQ